MELDEISEKYGSLIWKVSNNYHTGMWEPIDVYHEIIIKVHQAMADEKLGTEMRVKSFIITKAIDIVRHELYRQSLTRHNLNSRTVLEQEYIESFVNTDGDGGSDLDPEAPESEEATRFEMEIIREVILVRLTERDAKFVEELTFPSKETVEIALEDQKRKRMSSGLHMNVNQLKITTSHVAQSLSPLFGGTISKATISRIRSNAKEILSDIFEE